MTYCYEVDRFKYYDEFECSLPYAIGEPVEILIDPANPFPATVQIPKGIGHARIIKFIFMILIAGTLIFLALHFGINPWEAPPD